MTLRINGHLRWRKDWAKTKYGNYHIFSLDGETWSSYFLRKGQEAITAVLGRKGTKYEAVELCEKDYMRRVHDEYEEVCR